jgi:hypothetical protein
MEQLITTGELIIELQDGDVAKRDGIEGSFVTRVPNVGIVMCNHEGKPYRGMVLTLTETVVRWKWSILPRTVSWKEAYAALKSGATIKSHMNGMRDWTFKMVDGKNPHIDIDRIELGEWTIERGVL